MPYFYCRLASEDGRVFSQSFFSPTIQECKKHFEEAGYCILSIKRDWRRIEIPLLPFEKKIKDRDFILFNQELVALLKAGYPVLKSVEIIINRIKNVHLKELLMIIEKEIRGGKSLSEAFSPYEKHFSKVYIASLMAGERSGNLPITISRYVDYAKVIAQTKSKIRAALTYPTLLLFFSFILLGILINFILPQFANFYADFEEELPAITKALISFSLTVKNNLLWIGLAFILLILLYFQMKRKENTQVLVDRIKLWIPYGRIIWLESSVALFCRALGLLLGGGISLLSSIIIARQAVSNMFLREKMSHLVEMIKNGETLSKSLKEAEFFPLLALDLIRIGETSANLEGMLTEVADLYDERIRSRIDNFVSLIEPVIIIFMGLLVAAMLLSVYLPIFNILRVAK